MNNSNNLWGILSKKRILYKVIMFYSATELIILPEGF